MAVTKNKVGELFKDIKFKFNNDELIPVIIQDFSDNTVLMLAYMNLESIKRTVKNRLTCFWSRSRKKFWVKGETSGNFQKLKEIYYDCDGDTLLIKVEQIGNTACHTGNRSCFYRKIILPKKSCVNKKKL